MIGTTNTILDVNSKNEQLINYTMIYDGSLNDVELNECKKITGGWKGRGWSYDSNTTAKQPTLTKYSNKLNANLSKSGSLYVSGVAEITNDIDLTDFSNAFITFDASGTGETRGYSFIWFILNDRNENYITTDKEFIENLLYVSWDTSSSKTVSKNTIKCDISSIEKSLDLFFAFKLYYATLNINIYYLYLTKHDDWISLANIAGITATSIDDILTNSTTLLSNEKAVEFMIYNCTGDFMASAIQSDTFLSALNNSPYKTIIMANEHWNKFLNMVA